MGNETNMSEYEPTETEIDHEKQTKPKKEEKPTSEETSEIQYGERPLITNLLPACEKLDRMFGSGGEAIVHHMWLESGQSLFDNMIKRNSKRSLEELLRTIVDAQPRAGWGNTSLKIIRRNPPLVDIMINNPAVKTIKGSQKHLIGSFWAGVLSRYFNRQLTCKNFSYDAEKDEFLCTVTT